MATWLKEAISEEKRDEETKPSGNFLNDLTTGHRMNSSFLKKKSNPVLIDLMNKQLLTYALHRSRSETSPRFSGIP